MLGQAWVDLTPLMRPGGTTVDAIAPVKTRLPEGAEAQELVFESAQTYVRFQLALSAELNCSVDDTSDFDAYCARLGRSREPVGATDVLTEYQTVISQIAHEVSREYTRFFAGEGGAGAEDKDSPRNKPSSAVYQTAAQLREMREQKKEKFLQEFGSSPRFLLIRERFKKAVLLFAVEKFKKEAQSLTPVERAKFKAGLYVYLNEQMNSMLGRVLDAERQDISQDIWAQRDVLRDERAARVAKCLQESKAERAKRLALEFDILHDKENAEKWLVSWFVEADRQWRLDADFPLPLPKHCLKWGMHLRGEYYYQQQRSYAGGAAMGYVAAAILIQRGNFKAAGAQLEQMLDLDWKDLQANMLMGLLHDKLERPGLSRKHFAVAKCRRLRELGLLPPRSTQPKNFRTTQQEFKVEIVDFKSVLTKDQ